MINMQQQAIIRFHPKMQLDFDLLQFALHPRRLFNCSSLLRLFRPHLIHPFFDPLSISS